MKKTSIGIFLFLILVISTLPAASENINYKKTNEQLYKNEGLDVKFIYDITKNLSYIIFEAYNETNGEIAKGRAFGTKGEHMAADMILKNMTDLGLYAWREQISNTQDHPELTHKLEVIDYKLKINNQTIDSYIAPAWFAPDDKHDQLNHIFNYTGLKVELKPNISLFYNPKLAQELDDFVFIGKDNWNNLDNNLVKIPFFDSFIFEHFLNTLPNFLKIKISTMMWSKFYPHCKGLILYDFNNDTHNMVPLSNLNTLPIIFINGTVGNEIINHRADASVDFYLNQSYNESVVSYNIIGQLNGTKDPSKTVIIGCLYDCWWNQGTADSAIGMAMVLGIAKYFVEHNITPDYTLKFIAYGGEEYGYRGAKHYENTHRDENIIYVIDLNQLGFTQDYPKLTLGVIANKISFLREVWEIVKRTDYEKRVKYSAYIKPVWFPWGSSSDDKPFTMNRPFCKTVCFLKDTAWTLHHRDGLNHTAGDVIDHFNWTDVGVTGEIILNVTNYLVTNNHENVFTNYNCIYKDLNYNNLSNFQKEKTNNIECCWV